MTQKNKFGGSKWIDPDDAPELTEAFFKTATIEENGQVVRRGRPVNHNPKQQVTIRLDADVLAAFKQTGAGWQTRINDALRKAIR